MSYEGLLAVALFFGGCVFGAVVTCLSIRALVTNGWSRRAIERVAARAATESHDVLLVTAREENQVRHFGNGFHGKGWTLCGVHRPLDWWTQDLVTVNCPACRERLANQGIALSNSPD